MSATGSATTVSERRAVKGEDRRPAIEVGRILVAEDDSALRELLVELLTDAGHTVLEASTGSEALARFRADPSIDVVLTDLMMPALGGEGVLTAVRDSRPEIPVIVMTAFGSIDSAVRLVRSGAFDYVTKPVGLAELLASLSRGVAQSRERRATAGSPIPDPRERSPLIPENVIAESVQMRQLVDMVQRVSSVPHPVLVTGESGTGKEVVARLIHQRSARGSFVAVNCGAVPEMSIESELFGHERGAFTFADRDRIGLVEAADGGTLFLDEIGELPLSVQPSLLRFLESGEVRPVGSTQARTYDVRVIAASNRDLEGEMRSGRFREDLYWRLNVLHLDVAPLRERIADVPPMALRFLRDAGCTLPIHRATEALLVSYAWPGNVRELRNAMQRAATFATGSRIMTEDLPARLTEANRAAALVANASRQQLPLRAVERAYVLEVLRRAEGNKSRAAEILELDRKTLYRKLAEYAIEPDPVDGAGA